MKYTVMVAVLALVALVVARPDSVLDFEGEDHEHEQEGEAGEELLQVSPGSRAPTGESGEALLQVSLRSRVPTGEY
ncbi:putative Larval cuticle protein 2-like 2 [Homarus americanus]|uniref:Putative Larval cuticle protein 2-like 2 n=1 Tax=Homarus americanus TaxID=6706 RepID=A0A8J5K4L3_HOMAM|nr:putative Larval cuticle protein 2-like 2 [Homarus americanus]